MPPECSREVGRQVKFMLECIGKLGDVVAPRSRFSQLFSAASAHGHASRVTYSVIIRRVTIFALGSINTYEL